MKTHQSEYGWSRFWVETILIVLGVFLGLLVNELRIEQRNDRRAKNALEQIKNEILFNRDQVTRISSYHLGIRDSLNALLTQSASRRSPLMMQDLWKSMPDGFGVPYIQRHAWNLANLLGSLEYVDYSKASMLARTYDLQDSYIKKYERVADNFYVASNTVENTGSGLVLALFLLANDIVIYERDLLKTYQETLDGLNEIR